MRLPVLLLLTVASCSSTVVMAQELPDQATAIQEIKRLGGSIMPDPDKSLLVGSYSSAVVDGNIQPDKASPSQTGICVSLDKCRQLDDGIRLLKSIENLTSLNLSNTRITDEGLKELKGSRISLSSASTVR
jgi:hypothetical protein